MALGMLDSVRPRRAAARFGREPAPADRGDEARVRRRVSLRQRSVDDDGHAARRCSTAATSRERARLIDPTRAQDFGPGAPPRGGTVYICAADAIGHDGVADPVELHGLRLRRRRARAPASACRIAAPDFRSSTDHPNEVGRRQAAVPHDHSGIRHARRRAARGVRRHGRTDPAAGPRADARAHGRLRDESAGGARRAALEGQRRPLDRPRGERVTRSCARA